MRLIKGGGGRAPQGNTHALARVLGGCLAILALCSCPADYQWAGSGEVRVVVGAQASRSIVADLSDITAGINSYSIKLVDQDGNVAYNSEEVSGGVCTLGNVGVGSYSLSVEAYGSDAILYASASDSVKVEKGKTTTKNILLSPASGAKGSYQLGLSWPKASGYAYAYTRLDSLSAGLSRYAGTEDGGDYLASINGADLSGGDHLLYIYFGGANANAGLVGPFVEALNIWGGVESGTWIDPEGAETDTIGYLESDFSDTDCTLDGLDLSLGLDASFSPGTTSYGFGSTTGSWLMPGSEYDFTITASSGGQGIKASFNGASLALEARSATILTGSLTALRGENTLTIAVTAPNRLNKKSYKLSWISGAAGITVTALADYEDIGLPATATVVQGQKFTLRISNAALSAVGNEWSWYLDGKKQGFNGPLYEIQASSTLNMLGTYQIAVVVKVTENIDYSSRLALTVIRPAVIKNLSISGVTPTTLAKPYDICYAGGKLYLADTENNRILAITPSTGVATVLAGNPLAAIGSPFSLASDGTYLYAGMSNGTILKINLSTAAQSQLVASGLNRANGMWLDGQTLYVSEWLNGTEGTNDPIYAVNTSNGAIQTFVSGLSTPYRISGDASYLYVTEYRTGKVKKINRSTKAVSSYGYTFSNPAGIVLDGTNLYVCDADNSNGYPIARLALDGSVSNPIAIGFSYPKGICGDGTKLYVADTNNNAIKVISK